jgi:type IV pilus assembly protein PilO
MKLGLRELLFFVLMIGLMCGAYFILHKKSMKRAAMVAEVAQMQLSLTNLRASMAGIDDQDKKIDDLQQAITFFESKLPQEKEMDKVLKEVWQLAQANSLQTKTIKTLKAERSANYSEQPIQLSLSGDFNGFYEFLLQLEKLPRITRINQMKLEKISEHDGEMQAQMTMSIFFEPDTGSVASTDDGN